MTCQQCKRNNAIIRVSAKCSDLFSASYGKGSYDGYVPGYIGLGSDSDYVEFSYCADCGQMQGKFPLDTMSTKIFKEQY